MRKTAVRLIMALANGGKWLFYIIVSDYLVCTVAFNLIEHRGLIKSLWWAVVTGFTVGYGDVYPESTAGRFIGGLLIVSTWFLSLLAGAVITAKLIEDRNVFTHEEQEDVKASLLRIEHHIGTVSPDITDLAQLRKLPALPAGS